MVMVAFSWELSCDFEMVCYLFTWFKRDKEMAEATSFQGGIPWKWDTRRKKPVKTLYLSSYVLIMKMDVTELALYLESIQMVH